LEDIYYIRKLKLIADEGKIFIHDEDITNLNPSKRHMGIVFQNYALFPNMTVLQNVEYALKINKETKFNPLCAIPSILFVNNLIYIAFSLFSR
jgi:ABC-type molybdate transport system ATPase subunit